jgi:hypothetical protein
MTYTTSSLCLAKIIIWKPIGPTARQEVRFTGRLVDEENVASVLGPARFGVLGADRPLFAIADG